MNRNILWKFLISFGFCLMICFGFAVNTYAEDTVVAEPVVNEVDETIEDTTKDEIDSSSNDETQPTEIEQDTQENNLEKPVVDESDNEEVDSNVENVEEKSQAPITKVQNESSNATSSSSTTTIKFVQILNVQTPKAGEKASFDFTLPKGVQYEAYDFDDVPSSAWVESDEKITPENFYTVNWKAYTAYEVGPNSFRFKAGKFYTFMLEVYVKNEQVMFSSDTKATINGKTAVAMLNMYEAEETGKYDYDDGVLNIYRSYYVPASTEVKNTSVKKVTNRRNIKVNKKVVETGDSSQTIYSFVAMIGVLIHKKRTV